MSCPFCKQHECVCHNTPPATTVTTCHKCKQPMTMTPVCTACGIIPIATGSFEELQRELNRLREDLSNSASSADMHQLAVHNDKLIAEIDRLKAEMADLTKQLALERAGLGDA